MKEYDKLIFVGQTGACREAMAAEILGEFRLKHPMEILARGLVVLFPEPMNQKAEAVLISNGITPEGFTSIQLEESDFGENTLILTMETAHKEKILGLYENVVEDNIYAISEFVGEELDILDPYGGTLAAYGLCYESLRKTVKKLVKILNEGE